MFLHTSAKLSRQESGFRSVPQVVNVLGRLDDCHLENQYGPTESHVVTAYSLQGPATRWTALPPIGRPIANIRIYLLDPRGGSVPVGVPGELHIGGVGVGRGYLNRAELTAEKFVPDPFGPEAGARLYRTGDLVRYLADGNIEFLGRIDDQVKVRGFRVELGEIETVLREHPAVREASCWFARMLPTTECWSAYLVAHSGSVPHRQPAAQYPEREAAGVYAAVGLCVPGCPAPDAER